jgi:1-acyl-sn-glycerol-3-phosphate acyltransferase
MQSLQLLTQRKFAPFFVVQFFGAFNDNLFKTALIFLITFATASESEAGLLTNLASGLFIVPFLLFSPLAGQLADKFEKSQLIRITKLTEVIIMSLAMGCFFLGNMPCLMAMLFFLGAQAAFFGPVKYSILPQVLDERELLGGNALVELGTFLAILAGTFAAGILNVKIAPITSTLLVVIAFLGWLVSYAVPEAPAGDRNLKIEWNPIPETKRLIQLSMKRHSVFKSILAISWFWFFGAVLITVIPNFAKFFLGGSEDVARLLLATFIISTAAGAILCEALSQEQIEIGLVPIGALGLSLFAGHLFFIDYSLLIGSTDIRSLIESGWPAYWVLIDILGLGLSSSLFIVPLYALVQDRTDAATRSRVMAANNMYNSVFMVAASVVTMVLYRVGLSTIQIFMVLAIVNTVISIYIFSVVPEFTMRFVVWFMARTIYRMSFTGQHHIPRHGPALIVANHVSFIDWFIITAACRRPVRFVMHHSIYDLPILNLLFRLSKAISIAPAKENPKCKEEAFEQIHNALHNNQIVCIFPEGTITYDGEISSFKPGIEAIIKRDPVPVIPLGLKGIWGSFFSRESGRAMRRVPRPSRRKIEVIIDEPVIQFRRAGELQQQVANLIS